MAIYTMHYLSSSAIKVQQQAEPGCYTYLSSLLECISGSEEHVPDTPAGSILNLPFLAVPPQAAC